jgi:asparagine synthase (glutamine-hydrolysing)
MCGIAGIVGPGAEQHSRRVAAMLDSIVHRGPDGHGTWRSSECVLGHRRLSIIDLAGGAQPMSDPETGTIVTFNGEIYGYRELRAGLREYPFRSASDTEVILALYRKHGSGLVEHLPGMFAFALWDPRKRLLLCARDRFGEKPFFYAKSRGLFVFGSEIRAVLASDLVAPTISTDAVEHYCRRLYVHPHESIFREIHTLPPGHTLEVSDAGITVRRYWQPPEVDERYTLESAAEKCRELVARAVSRQLVADVPVGVFLSGGLDSSTITAVAAEQAKTVHTYSFNVEGGLNELQYARDVASLYRTQHSEFDCSNFDVAAEAERLALLLDEPLGDSSAIPMYLIAREARRHVTVVLTGDGGDELFGGYSWYQPLASMQAYAQHSSPQLFMSRLRLALKRRLGVASYRDEVESSGAGLAARFPDVLSAHEAQLQLLSNATLLQMGLPPRTGRAPWPELRGRNETAMNSAFLADTLDYMPGDILVKLDRTSMAHGLELRAPFLDVDLASFLLSLPPRLKVAESRDKITLRAAFSEQWPASVRNRQKQGFGGPLAEWLALPKMRELCASVLHTRSSALFDLLDYEGTQTVLKNAAPIARWGLMTLGLWACRRGASETGAARIPATAHG